MGLLSFLAPMFGDGWRGGSAKAAITAYGRQRVRAYTTRAGKKVRSHYRQGVKGALGVYPQGSAGKTAKAAANHNLTRAVQAVFGAPPKKTAKRKSTTRKAKQ